MRIVLHILFSTIVVSAPFSVFAASATGEKLRTDCEKILELKLIQTFSSLTDGQRSQINQLKFNAKRTRVAEASQDLIAILHKILKIDPFDRGAAAELGQIYLSQKEYVAAAVYLTRAIELGDTTENTLKLLADAYDDLGNKEKASQLKQLLGVHYSTPDPILLKERIELLEEQDNYPAMLTATAQYLTIKPNSLYGLQKQIQALIRLEQPKDALVVAERLAANPRSARDFSSKIYITRAYLADKQYAKALATLPVAEKATDKNTLFWLKARILYGQGNFTEAKKILLTLANKPSFPRNKAMIALFTVCPNPTEDPDLLKLRSRFSEGTWQFFLIASQNRPF